MTVSEAFGDVAEVLAKLDPTKIVELRASRGMAERVSELISKKKEELISWEETLELERYLALDLLINLAKVRARRILIS